MKWNEIKCCGWEGNRCDLFTIYFFTCYRTFQILANSEVQKPTDTYFFHCRQSVILTDLLGNRTLLKRVQRVKGLWFVSWWISIRLGCFCVWRFVACDCNYDWQQWRTPLWSRLLNFTACVFLKNAVTVSLDVSIWEWHWQPLDWITHQTNDVNDVCLIIIVQHSPSFM